MAGRKHPRNRKKWHKQTFKLPPNLDLGPVAKPGYNVFIADRGAVAFSYPQDWVVLPGKDSIKFHDRKPPDDDCVLQVSVLRLPPVQGGWGQVPLEVLVREAVKRDSRGAEPLGEIKSEKRPDLELAWAELRFTDPKENRTARSRCCLARANLVQPLLTMDFWESDLGRVGPVWDEVLRSLKVGLELTRPPRQAGWN
jgi:hypothetical protein